MLISTRAYLPFPRAIVYTTYRDRLSELVPYMPNIRQVIEQSRIVTGDRIELVNLWHGGGDIPSAARAVLSESMLSWTEHGVWDERHFTNAWKIRTHAYTEAVFCSGISRFIEDGSGTVVESQGELRIDSRQIREVPSFIAGMVGGIIEDFLGRKIEPNLQQMGDGVCRYLEAHGALTNAE